MQCINVHKLIVDEAAAIILLQYSIRVEMY